MKVLVACEFSGLVRDAFIELGHDATSCDLVPTEQLGPHYLGDVRDILYDGWDLMVAHPPCTYLASSGRRWWKNRLEEQAEALDFVRLLLDAPIRKIALENPIGVINSRIVKPNQIIQPWQFGHNETKSTCLWLKNLWPLKPTYYMPGRSDAGYWLCPSKTRATNRSRTFIGIAEAMADQWGGECAS